MEAVIVDLVTASGIADKKGYVDRKKLKEGDALIHEEAERERLSESLIAATHLDIPDHCLHPQHHLQFKDAGQPFSCEACTKEGTGKRYSCKSCVFQLHQACAISDNVMTGLTSENTKLTKFIHQHPLNLVNNESSSEYTCSYCNNKSKKGQDKYYYCEQCKMYFDLMCVNHPTRLLSFLHPEHELELKTRHHMWQCKVCKDGGDSHARVYTCELCKFFIHPSCAVKNQFVQHQLHPDHMLALVKVTFHRYIKCMGCGAQCKGWCYSCNVCKGISFHFKCIDPEEAARAAKREAVKLLLVGLMGIGGAL